MFRKMDEIEIEIYKIDNLKMVNIYEISGARVGEGCTAISVYYGDEGKISLNEMDVHYRLLINRVMELYRFSENKELILMDDNTRLLIENGLSMSHEKYLESYYNMSSLEFPKLSFDAMLGTDLFPLAEYLLIGIYKTIGMDLEVINRKIGWRGSGIIYLSDGKNSKKSVVNIRAQSDKKYIISISNFIRISEALNIEVLFENDHIELLYYSNDQSIEGKGLYYFNEKKMIENHEIYYNGKQIFVGNDQYFGCEVLPDNVVTAGEKKVILNDNNIIMVYRLPCQITYVLSKEQTIQDNIIKNRYCVSYIFENGKFSDIRGYTELINENTNIRLKLESMNLKKYCLDDGVVQTYFMNVDNNTLGEYKEHLAGKYFLENV